MKILIVKLNAIGDVLFATPLVEALRVEYPECVIDWLVGRHAEAVLRAHPSIRRRIVYDGPWGHRGLRGFGDFVRVVRELRRERYDLVFLLHRSFSGQVLVDLTAAPVRVGFQNRLSKLMLTHTTPFDDTAHETERYLNLLRALDHEAPNLGMRIGITDEAQVVADLLLQERDLPRPLIGIAPGGGRNPGTVMLIKRWPVECYTALAQRVVAELGGSVVVCGTPDEAALCAQVAGAADEHGLDVCGRTSLPQLAAVLAQCDVVVANDSGPLHIAAAAGRPTVGLFGPTDPRLVAPLGDQHRHLWTPPDCGPCYRPDNARDHKVWECGRVADPLRCLRDVPVDMVMAAVRDALARVPWVTTRPYCYLPVEPAVVEAEHGE